jgi:chromosome segregation ATPase
VKKIAVIEWSQAKSMDEVLRILQQMQRKAVRLERQVRQLQTQQEALQVQLSELESNLSQKEAAYAALEKQYEAAKMVKQLDLGEDPESLRTKIDLYLKEIDICLKNFGE